MRHKTKQAYTPISSFIYLAPQFSSSPSPHPPARKKIVNGTSLWKSKHRTNSLIFRQCPWNKHVSGSNAIQGLFLSHLAHRLGGKSAQGPRCGARDSPATVSLSQCISSEALRVPSVKRNPGHLALPTRHVQMESCLGTCSGTISTHL